MRARIATVCQSGSFYHSIEENRKYIIKLLDRAFQQKPDLVCLPETFTTVSLSGKSIKDLAEAIPGSTTDAFSKKAKANGCYIICPINTKHDSKEWNSAVIIDRSGDILGIYDTVHPSTTSNNYTVFQEGVTPGREVPVFDLDFGRIGIQICYDIGFPESWEELSKKGAKMVFWPSAYNGGLPLQAYAFIHHYYIVTSVRSDKSRIIGPCGDILIETDQLMNVIYGDINLDFIVSHYDFNYSIPDKIMKAYPGRVKVKSYLDEGHFLIEPIDDTLTTDRLQREFGFESTFQYHQRHREAYKLMLEGKLPLAQKAAHGDRPQYSKVED